MCPLNGQRCPKGELPLYNTLFISSIKNQYFYNRDVIIFIFIIIITTTIIIIIITSFNKVKHITFRY